MYHHHYQKGMTMWGMATVLGLIAFFTLLILNLLPPYLENMKVKAALESVSRQPDIGAAPREEIINMLQRRFDIEDVDRVELTKDLKIENKNRMKVIRIAYQVQVPLAYNISALIAFDDSVEVGRVE